MEAGKLRHRVTVQALAATTNDFGESVPAWVDFRTVWASIDPLVGRELWNAQQVQPDLTHTVKMRFFRGLTTAHRLLFEKTRVLNIFSVVDPEERHRELHLLCKEVK